MVPTADTHCIWIDSENKIASFHEIEHAICKEFKDAEAYQLYIFELIANWYRFQ